MVGLALVLFTWDLLRDGSSEVPPLAIWTSRLLRLTSIYYSFAIHCSDGRLWRSIIYAARSRSMVDPYN